MKPGCKVIGLAVPNEQFEALTKYCEDKKITKQEWLEGRLRESLELLVRLTSLKPKEKEE